MDNLYTLWSVAGEQYGGGSELLYSQFELHTREQKISQIVLLEVCYQGHRNVNYLSKNPDHVFNSIAKKNNKLMKKMFITLALFVAFQDAIYRIRKAFNKEFDSVFDKKEQDITKLKEKNTRIKKIFEDLEMEQVTWQPEMGIIERPEKLLVVEDYEVRKQN